jgi:gluconokinase
MGLMAILVLMGVSGCGKTTVGKRVAQDLDPERLSATFLDADWFHSEANVAKMKAGHPLDDADREPWIRTLGGVVQRIEGDIVVAFSGLKQRYRDLLADVAGPYRLFYLEIDEATAYERVGHRPGHYMPPTLVHSQFEALEPPADAVTIDATKPVADMANLIRTHAR